MAFWSWSKTAANNSSADSTINWAEGQAPSSVNDSARSMMARTAEFRDDIAGAIATGGTSTAYTVTSNQVFDTLAHMANQVIAFTPHTTNGATVTLNVDGLGAKPLRPAPSIELQSNTLIQGTPYCALYNNSDAVFYLFGVGAAPGVPLGAGMDYWGTTTPSSSFVFPTGQTLSRTTYATLFTLFGTTYGTGDGSTTFTLPDKTGRVTVMKEASVTRMTANGWSGNSSVLGSSGGTSGITLTTNELPAHTHGITDPGHVHSELIDSAGGTSGRAVSSNGNVAGNVGGGVTSSATTGITVNSAGSGNPAKNIQPTIVCNYILRVL